MKSLLLALALTLGIAPLAPAQAQAYPNRPIRIVTITPPGAVSDVLARVVADELSKETGATFVVENKPGALGMIAAEQVARAAPDGYTILLSTISTHAQNSYLVKNMRYDPIADFEQIGQLAQFQWILVSDPALPFHDIKDLVAAAKAAPGKYTFGYATASALGASKAFTKQTGIDVLPVAYKGQPLAMNDIMGGRVTFMLIDVATAAPLIAAGKLKGLAVASDRRSPLVPSIPTLQELGIQGADFVGWSGFSAPAKTPEPIVRWLSDNVQKVLSKPQVQDRLNALGILPTPSTPAGYKKLIQDEIVVWSKRLPDAGIKPE